MKRTALIVLDVKGTFLTQKSKGIQTFALTFTLNLSGIFDITISMKKFTTLRQDTAS